MKKLLLLFSIILLITTSCTKEKNNIVPPKGIPQGKFTIRFTREVNEDSITIKTRFCAYYIMGDTIYLGYDYRK